MSEFIAKSIQAEALLKLLQSLMRISEPGVWPRHVSDSPRLASRKVEQVVSSEVEFREELLESFSSEVEALQTALRDQEVEPAHYRFHFQSLRSKSMNVGAVRLSRMADMMERELTAGYPETIASYTASLEAQATAVALELRTFNS